MKREVPSILLIDDQPDNLHLVSRMLLDDYVLSVATSGTEGLLLAQKDPPDLILLDIRMPGMDGLETLKCLHESSWGHTIPVILMTVDDRAETQVSGLEAGAEDFIAKPIMSPVLKARVRNVLHRRQAEKELKRHRHQLEKMVAHRTSELAAALVAAETANRAKSAFLANMSHELRTPMNGILGMIELAKRRASDPKARDFLDKARDSADRLLAILNDILDLSRIEADRLILEDAPLHLSVLLADLSAVLGNTAVEKGLSLVLDLPQELAQQPLRGDPLRLGQILLNLLGNAIKFTESGEIIVRVRSAGETPEAINVRFEITDTGIGINPEAQSRLFQSFEQADSSMTRKYGGTGLGLAICKRLTELMGGCIDVISTPGHGSTFWFEIPLKRRAEDLLRTVEAQSNADVRLRHKYTGARILLAEDEPISREIACFQLEDAGLCVDMAEDGLQALEMARTNRYALILMDMQMPRLNGIETTRAIRSESLNKTTPILAMTANAYIEDQAACLSVGMNGHIAKPVESSVLCETLLRWLDQPQFGLSRQ